jgi:hypothetical protein
MDRQPTPASVQPRQHFRSVCPALVQTKNEINPRPGADDDSPSASATALKNTNGESL